jgi:hypothetical protein
MTEEHVRIPRRRPRTLRVLTTAPLVLLAALYPPSAAGGQGVTTGALAGIVADSVGTPIPFANVVAVHVPSGTQYRAVARGSGTYALPNLRVGRPRPRRHDRQSRRHRD